MNRRTSNDSINNTQDMGNRTTSDDVSTPADSSFSAARTLTSAINSTNRGADEMVGATFSFVLMDSSRNNGTVNDSNYSGPVTRSRARQLMSGRGNGPNISDENENNGVVSVVHLELEPNFSFNSSRGAGREDEPTSSDGPFRNLRRRLRGRNTDSSYRRTFATQADDDLTESDQNGTRTSALSALRRFFSRIESYEPEGTSGTRSQNNRRYLNDMSSSFPFGTDSEEDLSEEEDFGSFPMSRASEAFARLMIHLIARASDHPSFQGQPPASSEARDSLKRVRKISQKQLNRSPHCMVCMEDFEKDMFSQTKFTEYFDGEDVHEEFSSTPDAFNVIEMPCGHIYHKKCLFEWLTRSNQCPTCRYEIMTDNPDYNRTVTERMSARDEEIKIAEEKEIKDLDKHGQVEITRDISPETEKTRKSTKRARATSTCDETSNFASHSTQYSSHQLRNRKRQKQASTTSNLSFLPNRYDRRDGSSR